MLQVQVGPKREEGGVNERGGHGEGVVMVG